MKFNLQTRNRLVLSDLQYAVMRRFYFNGPGYKMPLLEWATIPGNTLNSLLDEESPVCQIVRGNFLVMTSAGHSFMARYENRDPFKEHVSARFCQRIRVLRNFKGTSAKALLQKAQHDIETRRSRDNKIHNLQKETAVSQAA